MLEVLREIGEKAFAAHLEKYYTGPLWEGWFLGAAPAGVAYVGQQAIEAHHKSIKTAIGKERLRSSPDVFMQECVPRILLNADAILDNHPVSTVSHVGNAPVSTRVLWDARNLLYNKQATQEVFAGQRTNERYFVWNKSGSRKMTAKRAADFSEFYDEAKLPKKQAQGTAREHFERHDKEIFKSVLVTATPVSALGDLRPWARTLGSLYKADDKGRLWDLACSCPVFAAGANRCVHVVACAGHLKFIDIPLLLTNMDGGLVTTARPSGRPAEVEENCLTKIVPNKGRTVEDWLKIFLLVSRSSVHPFSELGWSER